MKFNMCKKNAHRRAQAGFSMVEVLVSILLMTIGLLGISGLMMSGINNSTGFDLASRASQSANEIMDAMRANSTNAASYAADYGTNPATMTVTTLADADRKQWLEAVQRLPGGDGKIEVTSGVYTITIRFTNCMGTLSESERANCTHAVSNSEKREITFLFRV